MQHQALAGAVAVAAIFSACTSPDDAEVVAGAAVSGEPAAVDRAGEFDVRIRFSAPDANTPMTGTFGVRHGAGALGCSAGSFTEEPGAGRTVRELRCERGKRVGTITLVLRERTTGADDDHPGPWWVERGSGDFERLAGEGQLLTFLARGVDQMTGELLFAPET